MCGFHSEFFSKMSGSRLADFVSSGQSSPIFRRVSCGTSKWMVLTFGRRPSLSKHSCHCVDRMFGHHPISRPLATQNADQAAVLVDLHLMFANQLLCLSRVHCFHERTNARDDAANFMMRVLPRGTAAQDPEK